MTRIVFLCVRVKKSEEADGTFYFIESRNLNYINRDLNLNALNISAKYSSPSLSPGLLARPALQKMRCQMKRNARMPFLVNKTEN